LKANNEIVKDIVDEEVVAKIRAEQQRRGRGLIRLELRWHTFRLKLGKFYGDMIDLCIELPRRYAAKRLPLSCSIIDQSKKTTY
jgi:hypothetical protein